MTTDELNAIVQAVMSELEKAGVDFDFKAEIPQADDLVYVMRGTSDKYQGITVKWQNLLDIIVQKATEAKNEAVSAKDIALQTLATIQGIESNVSSMKSSVETSEANVASMKASVETSEARVTQIKSEAEQTLAEATQTVTGKADKTYVDGELAKKADITYVDGKLANKADKSELAVERARIDSLSTLPEGSTTGDAELIDLRIGADGVTYGNAGNAVRTQFSDLKGDLDTITSVIDFDEYDGYFAESGSVASATEKGEKNTEKFLVGKGDKVKFKLEYDEVLSMWACYCLYDSNKQIIGSRIMLLTGSSVTQYSKEINIDTAKYIAFSYRTYGKYKPKIDIVHNLLLKFRNIDNDFNSFKANVDNAFNSFKALDLVEHDGYINLNGSITHSYPNGEKYTDKISAECIKSVKLSLEYSQKRPMWIVYGLYKSDGTFVRNTIVNGDTIISTNAEILIDDDVDYIIFSYRSFGESKLQVIAEFNSYASAIYKALNRSKNNELDINSIKNKSDLGIAPFKFKPCYDHLFVNRGLNSNIPHESLYHVRLSRKMGFNIIEANVYPTSDGVFIVNHLNSRAFGKWFHHVDESTDISATLVSDVTWDWIVENVRYNSSIPKYRTRPCRLEEFLSECRQQNIIPFITSTDIRVIEMADKYMGKDNYIAYNGSRANCPYSIIYHWVTKTTKEEILAYCESIGRPFIYGMANPTAFTDDELKDIVDTLHENGYWIGTSYADSNWHKYSAIGFDMNGTQGRVNRIESGNIANLDSICGFNDFTVTNAEEVNGVLTFNSDGTIIPNIDDLNYNVCMVDVEIDFNGSITIPIVGEHTSAVTYTNDGTIPFFVAIPIINGSPKFAIQVMSGTTINDIAFKASKV